MYFVRVCFESLPFGTNFINLDSFLLYYLVHLFREPNFHCLNLFINVLIFTSLIYASVFMISFYLQQFIFLFVLHILAFLDIEGEPLGFYFIFFDFLNVSCNS